MIGVTMKPWDGSHPPPKEEDETMTDYTERFRTLSIPQMQQVLAFLCDQLRGEMQASGREVQATFDLGVSCILRGIDNPAEVTDKPPSRIIRSGDLVVGKRYRAIELSQDEAPGGLHVGDVFTCTLEDDEELPEYGCIDHRRSGYGAGWFARPSNGSGMGNHVTAVELVEDEPDDDDNSPRRHTRECNGESDPDGGGVPCDCCGIDPTIIRAAEGVTLEPGWYEHDSLGRFIVEAPVHPVQNSADIWCWKIRAYWMLITSVSRVGPKPASECTCDPEDTGPMGHMFGCPSISPKPASEPVVPDLEPAPCAHCRGTGYVSNHRDSLPCARCAGTGAEPPPGTAGPVAPAAGGEHCSSCWSAPGTGHDPDCNRSSKPAPPQQPAERVEPVAASDERPLLTKKLDVNVADLTRSQLESYTARLLCGLDGVNKERDAALATVAKLTAELEAAKQDANRFEGYLIAKLESARAGLNPKACGEMIATVRLGIGTSGLEGAGDIFWNGAKAKTATEALDKLAAMLGVEMAGG